MFASLLLAAALSLGPEERYGPYMRVTAENEPAFAVASSGILMTWIEKVPPANRARIHFGLLDANAHLVSPIGVVPFDDDVDAWTLSASSDGTSFLLVASALAPPMSRLYSMVVDSSGRLAGSPRLLMNSATALDNPAKVIWNGTQYLVWSGGSAFAIDRDGSLAANANFPPPTAIVAANGKVTTASWKTTPIYCNCHPRWFCSVCGEKYELIWTFANRTESVAVDQRVTRLVLGSNGIASIAAWADGVGVQFVVFNDEGTIGNFGVPIPAGTMGPVSVACDANECLIAAATTVSDVYGFVFDLEKRRESEVFSIAATGRRENFPQVHALGNGRFLAAYLSDLPGDLHLAGRIVITRSSRHRAVR